MTVKRANVSDSKKPTKIAKVDPVRKQVATVAKALSEAEISEVTRSLLSDALPNSLAVLKDERHDFQNQVVDMVEQQLRKIETAIEADVQGSEGEIATFAAENERCETAVTDAQDQHQVKGNAYEENKLKLAAIATTFRDAKDGLTNARDAQQSGDAELNQIEAQVQKLESAAENIFAPLKEGTLEDAKDAAARLLNAWSRAFEMDDSLVQAASAALSKKPDDRGQFCSAAVTGLDDALGQALASMKQKLADGDAAKRDRAAAVEQAEAALTSSRKEQNVCAEAFVQAKDAMEEAAQAISEAKASVAQLNKKHKKAESSLKATQAKLTKFRETALTTFCELRDRVPLVEVNEDVETLAAAPAEAEEAVDEVALAPEKVVEVTSEPGPLGA